MLQLKTSKSTSPKYGKSSPVFFKDCEASNPSIVELYRTTNTVLESRVMRGPLLHHLVQTGRHVGMDHTDNSYQSPSLKRNGRRQLTLHLGPEGASTAVVAAGRSPPKPKVLALSQPQMINSWVVSPLRSWNSELGHLLNQINQLLNPNHPPPVPDPLS